MTFGTHLRVMAVLWCAAGMIVSYVCGYELMYRDLQAQKQRTFEARHQVEIVQARNEELRARSSDRDVLEQELLKCRSSVAGYVSAIEDVKWQMETVISTCPGRTRPPRLPRP